ncbi:hypothetical protein [Roseicella sp. DB1501]|uniref:hypothetical protein n=1 Tax=Roseicella sp. DB1501 TaxID=2730925 RepID=UPI001491049E|nr:hypothetical protein [Roseicella sp. DB1501]NOG73729.1 hypothetical protein [Roseicella sp. DB1501]
MKDNTSVSSQAENGVPYQTIPEAVVWVSALLVIGSGLGLVWCFDQFPAQALLTSASISMGGAGVTLFSWWERNQ